MWNTLSAALRSNRDIVLNVASSGIASLLLPGGRTAHSRFKIPVQCIKTSICNIEKKDDLAGLLKLTKLIIWDEAPMANKWCFEALDKSLKDIMGTTEKPCEQIFGGKIVVFGGDFRKILPVVPRGIRSDSVHSTINASYIWEHCKMWEMEKISEPNDGYAEITIPPKFLLKDFVEPIEKIVTSTYPNLFENFTNPEFLQSRAILASTIEIVDEINDYITNLLPGDEKEFLSSDTIDQGRPNIFGGLRP
ncbi:uncharacterized protein LOC131640689 [Vicia villosa]|uniref:uncharacterized protein LOC131640689 n=1 Tax=Vicia villosa TaxID=3911 RepID=UPI00273B7FEF|nr:uncharacterized protein LOC131640689 [Vicia villosa]